MFSFRNVVIKGMTILAPLNAPNTDGIDPGLSYSIVTLYPLFFHSVIMLDREQVVDSNQLANEFPF